MAHERSRLKNISLWACISDSFSLPVELYRNAIRYASEYMVTSVSPIEATRPFNLNILAANPSHSYVCAFAGLTSKEGVLPNAFS